MNSTVILQFLFSHLVSHKPAYLLSFRKASIYRMSLVCNVVWHFCSVTWNSLSFWCEYGCYWWRSVQGFWGDIWFMLGTCAKNDVHSLLQLLWVHICVCILGVCLFFTPMHGIEKVTFSCCHTWFSERHSPSVLSQVLLAGWAPSACHWQSSERRASYCVHIGPAWRK